MRAMMSATLAGAVLVLLPFAMAFPPQDVQWVQKWQAVAEDPYKCQGPGVVAHDGTIYGSTGPNIKAFSLNGTLQWNLTHDGWSCYALRVGPDGTLYTTSTTTDNGGTETSFLIAVNPDGTVKWQASDPSFGRLYYGAIAISSKGDTVFVYSTTGYLTALTHGEKVWSKFIGVCKFIDRLRPKLVFDHHRSYFHHHRLLYVTTEATLFAFMPNGDVKWQFELSQVTSKESSTKEFSTNTVTLGPGGVVYVPIQVISQVNSDQSSLHLLALGPDGSLNWDVDIGSGPYLNTFASGTPAVSLDGSLVFVPVAEPIPGRGMTGYFQHMVALTSKGVIKWKTTATKQYNSPNLQPVVNPRDGLVYTSYSAEGLSALVPHSGEVVWADPSAHKLYGAISFASDGKTMLVSEFGQFVILDCTKMPTISKVI